MRAVAVPGLFVLLVACASSDSREPTSSSGGALSDDVADRPATDPTSVPVARGPTRAAAEEAAEIPQPVAEPTVAPAQRPAARIAIQITSIDAQHGEDGRGSVVPASDAIAIDLIREDGFGGRALDPVLHVGQLRFTRYEHPAPDRMRFVVADRAVLPESATVTLQWGDDRSSRVVVARAVQVPR